ncbi:hypothetical protein D3C80_1922170 [compost metagenome]
MQLELEFNQHRQVDRQLIRQGTRRGRYRAAFFHFQRDGNQQAFLCFQFDVFTLIAGSLLLRKITKLNLPGVAVVIKGVLGGVVARHGISCLGRE